VKKWNSIVACAVGSALTFSVPPFAYVGVSNTRNINGPVQVNADNNDWVTHVLPTGRVVSPVGLVNGAP
jgi:hypothetical protein